MQWIIVILIILAAMWYVLSGCFSIFRGEKGGCGGCKAKNPEQKGSQGCGGCPLMKQSSLINVNLRSEA